MDIYKDKYRGNILIRRLFGRRGINIQLRNEYESMKRSLPPQKMSQRLAMFPIQPFVYPLPVEYFGDTDPATGSELKAMMIGVVSSKSWDGA